MAEIEKVSGYKCPECDEIHEEEEDALKCCRDNVEKIDGWKCSNCGEVLDLPEGYKLTKIVNK